MGNRQCCEAVREEHNKSAGPVQDVSVKKLKPIPRGFVLLNGCTTMEEHEERVLSDLEVVGFTTTDDGRRLRGEEGLRAIGFEFRFVPCAKHNVLGDDESEVVVDEAARSSTGEPKRVRFDFSTSNTDDRVGWHSCKDCATRLFYVGKQPTVVDADLVKDEVSKEESSVFNSGDEESSSCSYAIEPDEDAQANSSHSKTVSDAVAEVPRDSNEADETCVDMQSNDEEAIQEKADTSTTEQITQQDNTTMQSPPSQPQPTAITPQNRNQYIADGSHYELLSTLSQEAAHDTMRRTFNLEWVTLCNDERHHEHVKALVDADHPLALEEKEAVQELLGMHVHNVHEDEKKELEESNSEESTQKKSTLLIATGRGKVRAGIFSRFHLLTAGIEVGTAWHNIREARIRDMGVVIIDPNARGEQEGMETFKRSVVGLFTRAAERVRNISRHGHEVVEQPMSAHASSIYILAHSASGGQLVRHLREDPSLLPTIRAIAFTDSTHNIQWCKDDPSLMQFLSTKNCIYLRSNDVRSSQSCIHVSSRGKDIACQCVNCAHNRKSAGVVADTDTFWEHRFGKIRTVWAGTADHALSNFAGHDHIWLHFDRHAAKDDNVGGS